MLGAGGDVVLKPRLSQAGASVPSIGGSGVAGAGCGCTWACGSDETAGEVGSGVGGGGVGTGVVDVVARPFCNHAGAGLSLPGEVAAGFGAGVAVAGVVGTGAAGFAAGAFGGVDASSVRRSESGAAGTSMTSFGLPDAFVSNPLSSALSSRDRQPVFLRIRKIAQRSPPKRPPTTRMPSAMRSASPSHPLFCVVLVTSGVETELVAPETTAVPEPVVPDAVTCVRPWPAVRPVVRLRTETVTRYVPPCAYVCVGCSSRLCPPSPNDHSKRRGLPSLTGGAGRSVNR